MLGPENSVMGECVVDLFKQVRNSEPLVGGEDEEFTSIPNDFTASTGSCNILNEGVVFPSKLFVGEVDLLMLKLQIKGNKRFVANDFCWRHCRLIDVGKTSLNKIDVINKRNDGVPSNEEGTG